MKKIRILMLVICTMVLFTGCPDKDYECVEVGDDSLCIYYDQNVDLKETTVKPSVTPSYRAVISVQADEIWYTWQTDNLKNDEIDCTRLAGVLYSGSEEGDTVMAVIESLPISINTGKVVVGDKVKGTFSLYSNKTCTSRIATLSTKELTVSTGAPKAGLQKYSGNNSYYVLTNTSRVSGMETEKENTPSNCNSNSCDPNCAAYSWAYVQQINTGSNSTAHPYYELYDDDSPDALWYGLNRYGAASSDAYKTAFRYIVENLQATSMHVAKTNNAEKKHWITVVGITKEAYETYVDANGNLNDLYYDTSNASFKSTLVILDQYSGSYQLLTTGSWTVDTNDKYGTPLVTP